LDLKIYYIKFSLAFKALKNLLDKNMLILQNLRLDECDS
jgi:hypothetical protein